MKSLIKFLIITMLSFMMNFNVFGQDITKENAALIIVDIQEFYFEGGSLPLKNSIETSLQAQKVLNACREQNILVVHVKHNAQTGFDIHKNVQPLENEKVITKDEASSFNGTKLHSFLKDNSIENIIICGMQTQMCVEATTRAGYDLGYACYVIEDACTTRDLKYKEKTIPYDMVHASTLSSLRGYYANILSSDEIIDKVKNID